MAILTITLLLFLSFILQSNAHFLINYPPSLGFDQKREDESPCGGATLNFKTTNPFHVSGDAIALTTLHPQSNFMYRATTDQTASGNWSVLALVAEYGLGAFCEPALSVPASWAGSVGILQVVQNAEDGVHYQCAAVNFVAGASTSVPSVCQNATGNSAAFVADSTLLPASATGTATATGAKNVTGATSTPSATATKASGAEKRIGSAAWWICVGGLSFVLAVLL